MNEPEVEATISSSDQAVRTTLRRDGQISPKEDRRPNIRANSLERLQGEQDHVERSPNSRHHTAPQRVRHTRHHSRKQAHEYNHEDADESSIYQPTLWWFTSTAFPLSAGTFGPIANLFSVCALVEAWRVNKDDGKRIADPVWLTVLNACSLFLALVANIVLLFNFARRIPYSIAQPITITLWYLSCIFLAVPIGLTHNPHADAYIQRDTMTFTQSYYYALISCVLYFTVSSLLLISTLGSTVFHAYPPSFSSLTIPQRTLMLQTVSFSLYLALGAGVFSSIEDWQFVDGVYWADYTLLTIGLGTDFPLETTLGRMLLIPYAAFGITLIGLVVSSVRGLVLERAKAKVVRRHLGKERDRWTENIIERNRLREASLHELATPTEDSRTPLDAQKTRQWSEKMRERRLMRMPRQLAKHSHHALKREDEQGKWHRAEFELMRFIEVSTENTERYTALAVSSFAILIVWIGGSLTFWACERNTQNWTYPEAFYFTYTTLLTIGYGDFYPNSDAGKPFFVIWSLISVPAMTVLISNMADTVVKWVQDVTVWVSKWTILPERIIEGDMGHTEKIHHSRTTGKKHEKSHPESSRAGSETLRRDIEHLGSDVERFEEEEGRPGSLAARLAREIAMLAKDLRKKPPKKYTWTEWERWLEMLGEREHDARGAGAQQHKQHKPAPVIHPPQKSLSDHSDRAAAQTPDPDNFADTPRSRDPSAPLSQHTDEVQSKQVVPQHFELPTWTDPGFVRPDLPAQKGLTQRHQGATVESDAEWDKIDWHWTWLGDQGPLFSRLTETEWIIEKLCFRLEKVLEDEIREARATAGKPKSSS